MNIQWYVLRSKPNKETALWRELSARGFECFYPQLHVCPANPRSRTSRPYFPGYLFVRTDMGQLGASTFKWMPFSSGWISFDGTPATVPENLIQGIRRHLDQINAAGGLELAGLKQGEAVMIQGGPFDGYEAILDARLVGTERVRVLLKLLRARQLNLELPEAQVKPVRARQR